jgi:hypothetical protein
MNFKIKFLKFLFYKKFILNIIIQISFLEVYIYYFVLLLKVYNIFHFKLIIK